MNNQSETRLMVASVRVRLLPEHPRYCDISSGDLEVFLFATGGEDAAQRAIAIVEQLPYEIIAPGPVKEVLGLIGSTNPYFDSCVRNAREHGLAVLLVWADESDACESDPD